MTLDYAPRLDILRLPQRRLWTSWRMFESLFSAAGRPLRCISGIVSPSLLIFFGNNALDPAKLVLAVPFLAGAIVTKSR